MSSPLMGQMNELGGDQTSQSMSMLEFTARRFGGFAFAHPIRPNTPWPGRSPRRDGGRQAACAGCA